MSTPEITKLLDALQKGEDGAFDRLFPLVYEELRAIAQRQLRKERANHTLNTTAIVHEAYLKMADRPPDVGSKKHFLAVAGRAMRQILVNYANARNTEKRGGLNARVLFDEERIAPRLESDELLALDEALGRLGRMDERQVRIVECRYFTGLTIEETAEVLGTSVATVNRDWASARLWLNREIQSILNPNV